MPLRDFFFLFIFCLQSRSLGIKIHPSFEKIALSFPYLARADPSNTIWVQNGTLFDVLDGNNGTGTVAVNAASFNVSCGYIPNTTVLGGGANTATWTVTPTVNGVQNIGFQLGMICKTAVFS